MDGVVCFLGAVTRVEGPWVFGKFIREDGRVVDDLRMPLKAFNIKPPVATVIIAKTKSSESPDQTDFKLKFRAVTLKEVKFLDRVEMTEAMNWIRTTKI